MLLRDPKRSASDVSQFALVNVPADFPNSYSYQKIFFLLPSVLEQTLDSVWSGRKNHSSPLVSNFSNFLLLLRKALKIRSEKSFNS